MCFHFRQGKSTEAISSIGIKGDLKTGVYNGFTFPIVSALLEEYPGMISHIKWGLIPSWSKDDSIKKYTLNARHETANQKPSFKNAKRCLVFADGFYEWKWLDAKGSKKQKYLIEYPDSELFAFAGLYDQWVDKETGEIIRSCGILTTQAKGIMREIHNSKLRMPITISKSNFKGWLDRNEMNVFYDFKSTVC